MLIDGPVKDGAARTAAPGYESNMAILEVQLNRRDFSWPISFLLHHVTEVQ
ncbi:MAG: hypothetical protein WDK95_05755 [Syntrophorhabdaceae bacterium]